MTPTFVDSSASGVWMKNNCLKYVKRELETIVLSFNRLTFVETYALSILGSWIIFLHNVCYFLVYCCSS